MISCPLQSILGNWSKECASQTFTCLLECAVYVHIVCAVVTLGWVEQVQLLQSPLYINWIVLFDVSFFQINHFPGTFQLGRKDRLWHNLSKMFSRFGKKEFGFFPQTFILPADRANLKIVFDNGKGKQKWIIKPVSVEFSESFLVIIWDNCCILR